MPQYWIAVAIYYDRTALKYSIEYCKDNHIEHPNFYVLTYHICPFISGFKKQMEALGGKYYLTRTVMHR